MSDPNSIEQAARMGMRYWASGVGIAATGSGAKVHGMTISSFTSLSLEPPRILISLDNRTRTHEMLQESQSFAVTLLNSEQVEISRIFAGQVKETEDRFAGVEWEPSVSGNPIISGGLAYFDCKVVESFPQGQQTVFIGEVVDAGTPTTKFAKAKPLLYFNRDYRRIEDEA